MIPSTAGGEELRRRLLLNLLPRPLLILQVQLDLALVHCPSINGTNPEEETNKQNKQHVENGKNTQGGNSSIDYSASLEGQSNERGPVLRQLATWLLQVQ